MKQKISYFFAPIGVCAILLSASAGAKSSDFSEMSAMVPAAENGRGPASENDEMVFREFRRLNESIEREMIE